MRVKATNFRALLPIGGRNDNVLFAAPCRSQICTPRVAKASAGIGSGSCPLSAAVAICAARLEARICPSIWQNHRRRKCLTTLQSQVPALQHCPLLNRILTNWNVWCDGGVVMDSVDFFAGL